MKNIKTLFFVIAMLTGFYGCDTVHEFPNEEEIVVEEFEVEILVDLKENIKNLSDHKVIDYKYRNAQAKSVQHKTRYIIEIYDNKGRVHRDSILGDIEQANETRFKLKLPLNEEFIAHIWVDNVDDSDPCDLYYTTSVLQSIALITENYRLSADENDAFYGSLSFKTDANDIDENGVIRKNVELIRPLAKFRIIATDLQSYYLTNTKKPAYIKLMYTSGLPSTCIPGKSITDYINTFTVTENVHSFTDTECTLTFDWVFALDEEINVPIRFEVYDEDNKLIVKSPEIIVPLIRNKLTTIRDRFLTTDYSGGIGIDDNFDGEINIDL